MPSTAGIQKPDSRYKNQNMSRQSYRLSKDASTAFMQPANTECPLETNTMIVTAYSFNPEL